MNDDPLNWPQNDEDDVNDFLESGGIPGAAFDKIGDTWEGTIVRMSKTQARDFETNQLQTWDDGTPKFIIHIDIQTNVRNPDIPGDDGVRRLYVRGHMLTAVRAATRTAGARMRNGGGLKVTYVRDGDQVKRGFQPAKLYEATYTAVDRPVQSLSADDLT